MQLQVVTPKGTLLEAQVDEVTAPGSAGEFGVLPGHVPLLSGLKPGVVSYRGGGVHGALAIGKGFAEVIGDRVVVLVDAGCKPAELDLAAAQRDLAAAQQELTGAGEDVGARADIEERRAWAQARLDLHARGGAASH